VRNPTLLAIRNVADCDAFPDGLLYVRSSPGADVHTGQPCWTIPTDSATGVKANAATAPIIVTAAPAAMRDRSPRVTKRPRAAHPVRTNRHRSLLTTSDNKSEFGCLDPAARRTAETFQHDAPRCSRETDVVAEGGDIALSPTAKRIPADLTW
jgi:hypothetical protein